MNTQGHTTGQHLHFGPFPADPNAHDQTNAISMAMETLKLNCYTFLVPPFDHITSPAQNKDCCLAQMVLAIYISVALTTTKFQVLSGHFCHPPLDAMHATNKLIGLADLHMVGVYFYIQSLKFWIVLVKSSTSMAQKQLPNSGSAATNSPLIGTSFPARLPPIAKAQKQC